MKIYYYRARYYDPETGRFINRDPIRYLGGTMNLYEYVSSNPVFWVDPYGYGIGTYCKTFGTYWELPGGGDADKHYKAAKEAFWERAAIQSAAGVSGLNPFMDHYTEIWNNHILKEIPMEPKTYDDIKMLVTEPTGTIVADEEIEHIVSVYKNIKSEISSTGDLAKQAEILKVKIFKYMSDQGGVIDEDSSN